MTTLEGWYTDPYDRHEQRWFSAGTPTALVRDAGVTANDEPPPGPYVSEPEAFEAPGRPHDQRRADEAEAVDMSFDPRSAVRAVLNDPLGAGPLMEGTAEE